MVKRAHKGRQADEDRDLERRKPSRQDVIGIRETLDDLAVARCPLCRRMLIARMGRRGPGFFCRCPGKSAARAA